MTVLIDLCMDNIFSYFGFKQYIFHKFNYLRLGLLHACGIGVRFFSCIGAAWFELTLSTTCRNPNSIDREIISSSPEPEQVISIANVIISCFNAYIQMNTLNKVS